MRIKPLLAGRLRPHRTPPRDARAAGPTLRIRFNDGPTTGPESTEPASGVDQARAALKTAADALSAIQKILHELDESWQAVASRIVEPAERNESSVQHPLAAIDAEQRWIDGRIAAIDLTARKARFAGDSLLDGRWSVSIQTVTDQSAQTLELPCIHTSRLGSQRVAGFVSSLATDGDNDMTIGRAADARAIIRFAQLQIAGEQEKIAAFLHDVIDAAGAANGVAAENALAASQAVFDPGFIQQAGAVTQIEALIAGKSPIGGADIAKFFSTTDSHTD